ncbi:MAG: MlaD family protein [Bacteroidota bacterium]
MRTAKINNVKLGVFVLSGLVFLVVLLYMLGKNISLFGSTYVLKARFENIQGLVAGSNVRYAGIQAGTVKEIGILNDTTIEVVMLIEKDMQSVIRKNAVVSISTDGLVGNKVVNISPSKQTAELAKEGDALFSRKSVNTDDMIQTLYNTNQDVAVIAASLRTTVQRINENNNLWKLLNDKSIPSGIKASIANIRIATGSAENMIDNLNSIIGDVKNGKGSAGILLRDSSLANNLNAAVQKIGAVSAGIDSLSSHMRMMVDGIGNDINSGKGVMNALLKDSGVVIKLNNSLDNIRKGTDGFNQNMEALKHNFLFRGYFSRLEKEKQKELKKNTKENKP